MLQTVDVPPAFAKHNERYESVNAHVMESFLITGAMNGDTLLADRFHLLLVQMGQELGGIERHGVKSQIGRKLGLSQPHVSQLISRVRNANWRTVSGARRKAPFDLDPRFFTDPTLDNPHYTQFIIKKGGALSTLLDAVRPVVAANQPLSGLQMLALMSELQATKQEQADLGAILATDPQPTREVVETTLRALRLVNGRRKSLDAAVDAADDATAASAGYHRRAAPKTLKASRARKAKRKGG